MKLHFLLNIYSVGLQSAKSLKKKGPRKLQTTPFNSIEGQEVTEDTDMENKGKNKRKDLPKGKCMSCASSVKFISLNTI